MPTLRRAIIAALFLLAAPVASLGWASPSVQSGPTPLVGTFRLTAGECAGGEVTGTYLRLVLPAGDENGPFVSNGDSSCDDDTYTPLAPGTDGGLVTGSYQPVPDPAFDGSGNGLAGRITAPAPFFGVQFSTATNPVDPQTEAEVPAPAITADGTNLTGQVTAFAAQWNNQHFNQGAPKPGGGEPGLTTPPTGTYDPGTGAFSLDWASHIEGGPFNNFTGVWHLEGVFVPAGGGGTGDGGSGGGGTGATSTTTTAPGGSATTSPTTAADPSVSDDDFTVPPPDSTTSSTTTTTAVSTTATTGAAPAIQFPVGGDDDSDDPDDGDGDEVAGSSTDDGDDTPVVPVAVAGLAIVGVAGVGARHLLAQRGSP